jgi:hypothetical protein
MKWQTNSFSFPNPPSYFKLCGCSCASMPETVLDGLYGARFSESYVFRAQITAMMIFPRNTSAHTISQYGNTDHSEREIEENH